MSISSEGIHVGQCYLTSDGRVRRVLRLLPDGRIRYRYRGPFGGRWRSGALALPHFAATVERPVPYDWTPETDI